MPFENPDITVTKWEGTPQYRLQLVLREGFYHSLGNVGRRLPLITGMMKNVHDPDLKATLAFLQSYQKHTEFFLKMMPALMKYCEEQAREVAPHSSDITKAADGRDISGALEVKQCEWCESVFEGHRLAKYCQPACREDANAAKAKDKPKPKKGKKK